MSEPRDRNGLTEAEFLKSYDASKFERPSVTVDVAAFKELDGELYLLLIKRGGHPFLGKWALPGGFVEPNETVDEAAARELFEETGIINAPLRQLALFSEPERDPRTRIITMAYLSFIDCRKAQVRAGDDAADAKWLKVSVSEFAVSEENGIRTESFKVSLSAEKPIVFFGSVVTESPEITSKIVYEAFPLDSLAGDHAKIIAAAISKIRKFMNK